MNATYEEEDFSSDTAPTEVLEPPSTPPVNLKVLTDAAVAAHNPEALENESNVEEPEKKKKKKKKKNNKKKNKNAQPTGFEDFFVEVPLSPEKAEELSNLYSIKKPFSERMELCIQRYRTKRRWDPMRMKLFARYLVLGGVRTGQKAYGGGLSLEARSGEGEEEPDAADIQAQTATDYIEHYSTSDRNQNDWKGAPGVYEDDEEWWVDFEYVAKAFLSHVVLQVFCLHTENDLLVAIKTIQNFLNYVVFHNVAPEYHNNILAALSVCALAEKELLFCNAALRELPGDFNMSCSALFGGHYHGLYEADQASAWEGKQLSKADSVGIPRADAEKYYLACIAKIGTKEQIDAGVDGVTLVRSDVIGFEIVDLEPSKGGAKELGYVDVKPWIYEGEIMPRHGLPEEGWRVWVEKELGMYLFKEMKMEAIVYTLSNGLRYMDTVTSVCPSFYTYLEPPNQNDGINDDGDE